MFISGDPSTMKFLYLGVFLFGFLTDGIESCGTGYFPLNGNCQACPKNCATCESESLCTMCYAGYFGENCSFTCPSLCHNNECNHILGECLSCKQGYFMDGNKTCKKCPENCITCESEHICFVCRNGYKGEYCQDVCTSCKTGTSCDKKTGYCFNDCIDGFSGELCDKSCDSKCKICNRYKENECDTCAPDRHGPSCDQQCSKLCVANTCDSVYGICTFGCKHGFWGELCEKECSQQCINKICDHINGKCNEECIEGNDGMHCKPKTDIRIMPDVIGGVIGGVLSVISIVVLVACFVYRGKRRAKCSNSNISEIENPEAENKSSGNDEDDMYAIPDNQKIVNPDIEKPLLQPDHYVKEENILLLTRELKQADIYVKDTANISSRRPLISSLEKKDDTEISQDIGTNIDGQVDSSDGNQEDTANISSRRPLISTLEKKDDTKISQDNGKNLDYHVVTFNANQEELIIPIVKNMNIHDKPTNNSIKITALAKYVAGKTTSSFYKEFQNMSKEVSGTKLPGSATSRTQSKVPQIGLPVVLNETCKALDSINANFIDDGSNDSKAYIAYMGSVPMLRGDMEVFWKIVWQERCSTVVMLGTQPLPEEKCTCTSEPCSVQYHDLTVECHSEINIDSFTIRKYTLKKNKMERDVQRLQFTGWTSSSLPEVSSFVEFVNYVKKVKNKLDGPTMVYCRHGKEFTGTYIALDILTKQGIDTGWVDIQGCVRRLLEQRVKMLQDYEQYEFLHKALVCSLTSECKPGTPV